MADLKLFAELRCPDNIQAILLWLRGPKGPAQTVAHLRRFGVNGYMYPALTDGATHYRSFGPGSSNEAVPSGIVSLKNMSRIDAIRFLAD